MKTMYMVGIALLLLLGLAGFAGFYSGNLRFDSGRITGGVSSGMGGSVV
jgi:hypothetical protein